MNTKTKNKLKPHIIHLVIAVLIVAVTLAGCAPAATPVPPTPTTMPPTPVPATPTTVPPTPTVVLVDPAYIENAPVAVVPPGEPGQPMVTAAFNTSIRSGPGTNFPVYSSFLGSATAIAVGISTDSRWFAISVPVAPGGIGWVSAVYVLPQGIDGLPVLASPPAPPSVAFVPPAAGDPQATALAEIFVRTGPGNNFPAYGFAPLGANARVLGKSEDGLWLVVRIDPRVVGAGHGWVTAAYTRASNIEDVPVVAAPEQTPPIVVEPPPSGAAVATAIDFVNLRSGPGINYLILGTVSPGATGEIIGRSEDGNWWQVKVPVNRISSGVAWVSANWVITANAANVPVVAAPPLPPTSLPTAPPSGEQCVLVSQQPADFTTFPTGSGFSASWVLRNTGAVAWNSSEVDVVFQGAIDGIRLHQNWDIYDLPTTVAAGESITLTGGSITPSEPGQYGEVWALQQGSQVLCTFRIIVNVQ
jgi:uncharacterized protein YraI